MMRVSLSLTKGPGEYVAVVLWFYPPLSFVLPFVCLTARRKVWKEWFFDLGYVIANFFPTSKLNQMYFYQNITNQVNF